MDFKTYFLVIITILWAGIPNLSGQNLSIPLSKKRGSVPYKFNYIVFTKTVEYPIDGIPENLQDYKIFAFDMQKEQGTYERYLTEKMDSSDSLKFKEIDTLLYSKSPTKHTVHILSAITETQKIIIPDANNNLNFQDDIVFTFDKNQPFSILKNGQDDIIGNEVTLHYEYFDGKKRIPIAVDVEIQPRNLDFKPFDYEKNIPYYFNIKMNEHKTGFFSIDNEPYKLAITPSSYNFGTYSDWYLKIEKKDQPILTNYPSKNLNRPSEYLYFGKKSYLPKVSLLGDSLILEYKGEYEKKIGKTESSYFPNFSSTTIEGDSIKLEQYKEYFLLFDFWGTWCKPCIEEIPNLKSLYKIFKHKNFEIISVAYQNDKDKLKAFVETTQMDWQHVLNKRNDSNGLVQELRISSFPTFILVSPDGEILHRSSDLEPIKAILSKIN